MLLVGTYQLLYLRTPDHAALNETVAAVRQLKKPWAKGLVNAVLRKVAQRKDGDSPSERSVELPEWIIRRLERDFPDHCQGLFAGATERAPMSVRVNVSKIAIEDYLARLAAADIEASQGNFPEHLILHEPVPVHKLPGYPEGEVSVQDAGAQLAAHLAPDGLPERPRILDACAAPGGKLFHLAERFPNATLIGLELSPRRLEHMSAERERLSHDHVRLLTGDARERSWLSEREAPFDLILLDAPCTGSGTLRRHPDIKVLRKDADVVSAAALQLELLENLWPLVAEGGCLIYCTCSLFAEENDEVISTFLERRSADEPANAATADALELPLGVRTRFGWQLLPLPATAEQPNRTVDGFYFSRLLRQERSS